MDFIMENAENTKRNYDKNITKWAQEDQQRLDAEKQNTTTSFKTFLSTRQGIKGQNNS